MSCCTPPPIPLNSIPPNTWILWHKRKLKKAEKKTGKIYINVFVLRICHFPTYVCCLNFVTFSFSLLTNCDSQWNKKFLFLKRFASFFQPSSLPSWFNYRKKLKYFAWKREIWNIRSSGEGFNTQQYRTALIYF